MKKNKVATYKTIKCLRFETLTRFVSNDDDDEEEVRMSKTNKCLKFETLLRFIR